MRIKNAVFLSNYRGSVASESGGWCNINLLDDSGFFRFISPLHIICLFRKITEGWMYGLENFQDTRREYSISAKVNKSILFLSYVKFFDEPFFSNFRNVIET